MVNLNKAIASILNIEIITGEIFYPWTKIIDYGIGEDKCAGKMMIKLDFVNPTISLNDWERIKQSNVFQSEIKVNIERIIINKKQVKIIWFEDSKWQLLSKLKHILNYDKRQDLKKFCIKYKIMNYW